ncbi:MAG TPA: HEAT repeat domain-containing protein, partial [Gemmatimonadales bacterium]|nr:HEAT repeat domain-containing protein [Gemmatimonadales bacterium]
WRDRALAAELLGRVGGAKAVPALLETAVATRTEDVDVREVSFRALARIADPAAVEPLIVALGNADSWLAPRIADVLSRHGEAAVDPLIAAINESSPASIRGWGASVLGEVRATRGFPTLVHLLSDADDDVRGKAATALGRLRDRRATGYLLQQLLSDPAPFVRARIASSLGVFGDPEIVDRLVSALGDPAWWVRMRSVEALERIGSVAEAPLLLALDDSDAEIRARAAVALERLGVTDTLVRMLETGGTAPEAHEILVKFAAAGAREFLAELTQNPSSEVRSAAVTAIGRAQRPDLSDALIQMAGADRDAQLRAQALSVLGSFGRREALPAAHGGLADGDHRVRAAAVSLIGRVGDPADQGLLRAQTRDPEPAVRGAAVQALGSLGATGAEDDVGRLLQDPDANVRGTAAEVASSAGLRSLLPDLADLLSDRDPTVRCRAAAALGGMGDAGAVPMLLRAFPDPSDEVTRAIAVAVSRLDPEALGSLADLLLDSPDVGGKLNFIESLPRSHPDPLPVLHRLRNDASPAVRAAAIERIGWEIRGKGSDNEGRVAVETGLRDPEELVRARAVDAWARIARADAAGIFLALLEGDPSPLVRERAALAIGRSQALAGEGALTAACRRAEPANVRAAAALAGGVFDHKSIVARVVEMPDHRAVRELLRERLKHDPEFRLLGMKLSPAHRLELRAALTEADAEAEAILARGTSSLLHSGDRLRLISSLRAFRGEQSRDALLQMIQADPTAEVRAAALASAIDLLDPNALLATASRALWDPSVLVRRAAVLVFGSLAPEAALPRLIGALRVDDDPAVLAAAAGLAEEHFDRFTGTALGLPVDSEQALLVVRIARHVAHPELGRLLRHFAASSSPDVRAAVIELWAHRPDVGDPASLETLTTDPDLSIRCCATGAALAADRYDLLQAMAHDPHPSVRREVALALGRGKSVLRSALALERLDADPDAAVRSAAYVARLLQGIALPLPPELDGQMAAQAVRQSGDIPTLREAARTSASEERRLAAALALALLQDDVAREVARTDPAPSIRHRISGALDLSVVSIPVVS